MGKSFGPDLMSARKTTPAATSWTHSKQTKVLFLKILQNTIDNIAKILPTVQNILHNTAKCPPIYCKLQQHLCNVQGYAESSSEQKHHIWNSYASWCVCWLGIQTSRRSYKFETLYKRQFVCSFTHMCMCTEEVLKTWNLQKCTFTAEVKLSDSSYK